MAAPGDNKRAVRESGPPPEGREMRVSARPRRFPAVSAVGPAGRSVDARAAAALAGPRGCVRAVLEAQNRGDHPVCTSTDVLHVRVF